MSWIAVDKNGCEYIYEFQPVRMDSWWEKSDKSEFGAEVEVSEGTSFKLTNKQLTWEDEAVHLIWNKDDIKIDKSKVIIVPPKMIREDRHIPEPRISTEKHKEKKNWLKAIIVGTVIVVLMNFLFFKSSSTYHLDFSSLVIEWLACILINVSILKISEKNKLYKKKKMLTDEELMFFIESRVMDCGFTSVSDKCINAVFDALDTVYPGMYDKELIKVFINFLFKEE